MISFEVELPASSVEEEHSLSCSGALAPDIGDVLFDGDTWFSSMLSYDVAGLP